VNVKYTKPIFRGKTNWKKLRQSNDNAIDYTENPPTDEKFWEFAEVVMPSHKKHISVRFDEDVINFFKDKGKGYQSMMNAVLRSYMKLHIKKQI
jgi:uncharacterized protein (DUF4415 family)